jgi:hypothetical protein
MVCFLDKNITFTEVAGYETVKTTSLLVDRDTNLHTTDSDGWTLFHSRS